MLEVEHHRLLVRVEHHERVGLHLTLPAPDDVAFGPLDLEHPGAHEAKQQTAVGAVIDLPEIEHEHALQRAADRIRGRHDVLAPQALAGMIMVFTPCPAAAWANASPIRSSGNCAVSRRLRPSFGSSESERRYAVPRPNALPILISRKWMSQRSSGQTLPLGFTPTSWKKPLERVSASASLTSSGLPTASQTTSAPRPCVSSSTRSRRLSRAGSITTAAPRLRAIFRRSSIGSDMINRLAPSRPASTMVTSPMMPPPITSTVAPRGILNVSRPARQQAVGSVIAAVIGSRPRGSEWTLRAGKATHSAKPPTRTHCGHWLTRPAAHSAHFPQP